jgi:hypothetical protein
LKGQMLEYAADAVAQLEVPAHVAGDSALEFVLAARRSVMAAHSRRHVPQSGRSLLHGTARLS